MDVEEYIRMGDLSKRNRAQAWQTAIGIQAVDSLHTFESLHNTAVRHREGEITVSEVQQLIHSYYQTKANRIPQDDDMEEADKVAGNIIDVLSTPSFGFYSITPALKIKVVRLLYPNSPRHPKQRYLLTIEGLLYSIYLKTKGSPAC